MKLLSFKFKNIFSLGEGEINLGNRGLILVTGHSIDEGSSNGSGKSSLANKGILWTLYGATAGGLKADDVLNRHGNTKSCYGSIDFIGVDGRTYTVTRSRPAKLEFLKEGSDISTKKASETQLLIDAALGIDFKTFIQTYMFGQGRLNSYASLPAGEQKAILEQILPIEQLAEWVDYAKSCVSQLHGLQAVATGNQIKLKAEVITHGRHVDDLQAQHRMWDFNKEKKVASSFEQLSQHTKEIADKHKKVKELEAELSTFKDCNVQLTTTNQQILKFQEAVNESRDKLAIITSRVTQWEDNKRRHVQAIVKLVNDTCPTCSKPGMDASVVERIVNNNCEHERDIEEATKRIDECKNVSQLTSLEISALQSQLRDLIDEKTQLERQIETERQLRMRLIAQSSFFDRTEELTKIAEATISEVNPFDDAIAIAKVHSAAATVALKPITEQLGKIETELEHLHWWLKIYGHDAKMKLFENVCYFLDEQTAKYLKELNNSQLKVQFSTVKMLASGDVKEDFNVRVYSEKGGEGYETLSGGEQQIVSFAISKSLSDLAKAQTSGSSEFQILDEPFSMLDPRNCESLINFLTNEQGTIMLISNDEHLMNLVPGRIHVVKENGITTVASGT